MPFEIVPAYDVSLAEQARVANAAFANYVGGWAEMDANSLARFLLLQGADLFYSRFVRGTEGLVGFGYINRTADVLRLCGMALIAEARGTGAAGQLLTHLLDEGKQRDDATMVLEVIEQNPRAIAFYRRHGFREIAHLSGWRRKAGPSSARELPIEEITVLNALRTPPSRDHPAIPWAISRHAVTKVERAMAFRVGDECITLSEPSAGLTRVHGLFSGTDNWSALRAMLGSLLRRHADREFFAPAVWPAEFGREVFEPLGFTREPITQFLMRCDL